MRKLLLYLTLVLIVNSVALATGKISIGVILYNSDNIESSLKELKDLGFATCQLAYNNKFDEHFAKRLKKASIESGIKVTTVIGVPGKYSTWNFKEGPSTIGLVPELERDEKIYEYKKMIDFCVVSNIPAIHSHFGFIPEDPKSQLYVDFIKTMKELSSYAKDKGIMIYFETGQETPITLVRAIKDIGTGNIFVNCDLANLLMYGKANAVDAVRIFGNLIKEVHAKDGKYPDPNKPYELGVEVNIPNGDVNFPAVIKQLKEQDFSGSITIECELNGNHREYIIKTKEYLQKLIDNN
ncbi:MAG: sugar phosphate isomerase/epimerase [Parabacteroides sp.]|nr:sugar phosphate isomerase/epimerase [Parabacteroides sp.]